MVRRLASSSAWRLRQLGPEALEALAGHDLSAEPPDGRQGHEQELGEQERAIAAVLSRDARAPFTDLARTLGTSESSARRLATSMFRSGLLRPRVEIEPRRLGFAVEVVLSVTCRPQALTALTAGLADHPATRFLGITAGSAILTYDGVFRDEDELANFLIDDVHSVDGISRVECSMQVEVLKRYWVRIRPSGGTRSGTVSPMPT